VREREITALLWSGGRDHLAGGWNSTKGRAVAMRANQCEPGSSALMIVRV
jgi:hypothetical protein